MKNDEVKKEILDLIQSIQVKGLSGNNYSMDKTAIRQLFDRTDETVKSDILLRLTVIDSMYSTQMNRRYYALTDLTEAMYSVQNEKNRPLADLFKDFAKTPDASIFDYSGGNLFRNHYGIGKDGNEKGIAISLISKYAYFTTGYEFPIFDTIVCETLPCLIEHLGIQKTDDLKIKKSRPNKKYTGDETMVSFVNVINKFISILGSNISYDSLDRLLWFVGKIRRGNLSLVLSREEYDQCIKYLNSRKESTEDKVRFNIAEIEAEDDDEPNLQFVKPQLRPFFKLAKVLGSLVKYKN